MFNNSFILDTTYILPLFGISIDLNDSFIEDFKQLFTYGLPKHSLILPSVCLIEVIHKLNREYRKQKNPAILGRYSKILPTITKNPLIKIFNPFLDALASTTALELRKTGHKDLMDCWIASTAWRLEGILISEDKTLRKILSTLNTTESMEVLNWKEFANTWLTRKDIKKTVK